MSSEFRGPNKLNQISSIYVHLLQAASLSFSFPFGPANVWRDIRYLSLEFCGF